MRKAVVCLAAVCALSVLASSASATVLRVVVVQADAQTYMKELERGKAILKRLGSPAVIRVWQARFAGNEAGAVVASIEYADLETMAKDEAKEQADPEFSAWLKGLDKVRKIVSDSLYTEVK